MGTGERLQKLMYTLGFKSKMKFAQSLGKKRDDIIRNVIDKGQSLSDDALFRICQTYDNVNPNWLLTGEGEMFLSKSDIKDQSTINNCELCKEKDFIIENLKIVIKEQSSLIEKLTRLKPD